MISKEEFPYKGWYWFCPIYLTEPNATEPTVVTRWWVMEPLFYLATWCDSARIFVTSMLVMDYDPHFMFRVTGRR